MCVCVCVCVCVCLAVTEADDESRAQKVETAADDDDFSDADSTGIEMTSTRSQYEGQQTPMPARYKALKEPETGGFEEAHADDAHGGLSGSQDAAIAGIVTAVGFAFTVAYWYFVSPPSSGLHWRPGTHYQWWFAMLGGCFAFLHYYFLLNAFESAPSTVLLPLVQVASVSVLLGSSLVALYRHEPWITPTHALAYLLMFVGGILPACAGQLQLLLQRSFWRQSFVTLAIASEFSLGAHDLMLSGCAYTPNKGAAAAPPPPPSGDLAASGAAGAAGASTAAAAGRLLAEGSEDSSESFEFFVWSRVSFCVTFVAMYTLKPSLARELRGLVSGRVDNKYIALSTISEGLTIIGFYLASIAYGLFYQAGIVHAAEASLSQLLNLMLAYVLLRACGLGRSSAVSSMRIKFVSFVMVTIGLFLCTLEGEKPVARGSSQAAAAAGQAPTSLAAVPYGTPVALTGMGQAVTPLASIAMQRMMRRRRRL